METCEEVPLNTNMRVQLQNNVSATSFMKKLLDDGYGKIAIDLPPP